MYPVFCLYRGEIYREDIWETIEEFITRVVDFIDESNRVRLGPVRECGREDVKIF